MIRRVFSIIAILFKASLQTQLQYRGNLMAGFVASALGIGSSLIGFWAIFSNVQDLGGWHFNQVIALVGVAHIAFFVMDFWLWPNLSPVSQYVQKGEMDTILIKPVHPLLTITFRHAGSPGEVGNLIWGLGVLIYGMGAEGQINGLNALLFVVVFGCGIVTIYAIWAALVTLAFWFTKVEEFASIFYFTTSVGNYPVTAFPPVARVFFTFILPVAFVTNIPAQAAMGQLTWQRFFLSFAVATIALICCGFAWRQALKVYTSASS